MRKLSGRKLFLLTMLLLAGCCARFDDFDFPKVGDDEPEVVVYE